MVFKNINSDEIEGLIVCSEPPISSSPMKIKETEIDGRDITIVEKLGYKSYTKTIEIGLKKNADINKIFSYFSGEGDLIFNCENDKVYKAAIYEQINLERLLRLRKGTVTFYCQPFKYKRNDVYIDTKTIIVNEGNTISKPVVKLEKTNNTYIDITIGGIRFKYTFDTNDSYVEIDCEEMTALYEGLNRNRNLEIGFEFPSLQPGINNIVIHSGNAVIKVKRKDRWL